MINTVLSGDFYKEEGLIGPFGHDEEQFELELAFLVSFQQYLIAIRDGLQVEADELRQMDPNLNAS